MKKQCLSAVFSIVFFFSSLIITSCHADIVKKVNDSPTKHYDLLVFSAMPSELKNIISHLEKLSKTSIKHVNVYDGNYRGKSILAVATGVGKVNASIVSSIIFSRFSSKKAIFIGIAGSLKDEHDVSDYILGNEVCTVEHLTVKHSIKDDINPNFKEFDAVCLDGSKEIQQHILSTPSHFNISSGRIATTDVFPPTQHSTKMALKLSPDAIEMEGFAFYKACKYFDRSCLVIRSISDNAKTSLAHKYMPNQYSINPKDKALASKDFMSVIARL